MMPTGSVFRTQASLELSNNHPPALTFSSLEKTVSDRLELSLLKPPPPPDKAQINVFKFLGLPDIPALVSTSQCYMNL